MLNIGIIREEKTPPDSRVPLTPQQCAYILDKYPVDITVEPSPNRCYDDAEYIQNGIRMSEYLGNCEVLMGVKEVPIEKLTPNKTYLFFSHTIKEQVYNRPLLQAILDKKIRLIDYEVLTNKVGKRLIAFGKFAGMVGAHNGIMAYGKHMKTFTLKRMNECHDYEEAKSIYDKTKFPPIKVVVTGGGRVAKGAMLVLDDMGFEKVSREDFLNKGYDHAVYTQVQPKHYVAHQAGVEFVKKDFYKNPENYRSTFKPYTKVADVMVNGIYWDNRAPAFFTKEEMSNPEFKIRTIADVTCDIAPVSSIPSTLFASTIEKPVFGYDPATGAEIAPYLADGIDMMTVDNLPNELPRDASQSFGEQFINHILEELINIDNSDVIHRATVAIDGKLGEHFQYLEDYVKGEDA